MSDPKRLVDEVGSGVSPDGCGGLGSTLLASAHADGPSRRSRERAAAALGIAVGVAALTSGSAATAGAGAASAAAGGGAAKAAATGIWLKVIAGTLVTAAVAGGGVVAVQRSSSSSSSSTSTATTATTVAVRATTTSPTPSPPPTTTVATVEPDPAATVVVADPAPPVPSAAKHRHATPASSDPAVESALTRELRALDTARLALDRGDPNAALVALDQYDRTYPNGSLRTEASVARVDALLARGDKTAARKLAREVLAKDPSGPHARRLQKIAESP